MKISLTIPSVKRAPTHRPRACPLSTPKPRNRHLGDLAEDGGKRIGRMHREYLWAQSPRKGRAEKAATGYRMRMLTLELWQKWPKIRLHLEHPEELGLDGTDNASERSIGRSKV